MRTSLPSLSFLLCCCLLASACTKKTIYNEAPADASADPNIATSNESGSTAATPSTINSDPQSTTGSGTTASGTTGSGTTGSGPTDASTTGAGTTGSGTTNSGSTATTANMVVGTTTTSTQTSTDTTTVTGTGTTNQSNDPVTTAPDSTDQTPDANGSTGSTGSNTIPETVTGVAGMAVNCQQTLPCKWVSEDTQFNVTVTSADNIGRLGRLHIDYSVLTTHDSEVTVVTTDSAIDANGANLTSTALNLGTGTGGVVQGLLAGSELLGSVEFNDSSGSNALASWSIGLSDSGLTRNPIFNNLPVGSATTLMADCANTLPCAWTPPNADVSITLLSVSGTGSSNLLTTNFSVITNFNTTVVVDAGATAVGTDGASYRGRTHAIASDMSAEKLTRSTVAGAQVVASVFFYRTQSMSPVLQNLSLVVYEDNPVPRWNPMFTNVPVQ